MPFIIDSVDVGSELEHAIQGEHRVITADFSEIDRSLHVPRSFGVKANWMGDALPH